MKPIYEPKGAAKEYGDFAINIYTGCPHRCFYCYAPRVLHMDKEQFHLCVEPRKNIVEEVRKQVQKEQITGKLIHLCSTCDPYPTGYDTTPTREIIKILKESGNHVQILTKGNGKRDLDLLDANDWYGVTFDGQRGGSYIDTLRFQDLFFAKKCGVKTWASFDPVIDTDRVILLIELIRKAVDKIKIEKLNYSPPPIDWADFGRKAEALCKSLGLDYYIKDSLREEMGK